MATTVQDLNVRVNVDAKDKSKITDVNKELKNTGDLLGDLSARSRIENFEKLSDSLSGISNVILGVGGSVIQSAMNFEKLEMQMLTATRGNKEMADSLMQWAKEFAASTPFEVNEIVAATVKLQAYGFEAKNVLKTIGDLAAGYGKGLNQAIEAVADAQTGELERLKEFAITKKQLVDKAREMFNKEIVDSKNQITDLKAMNEALFAIMTERTAGGMENLSKTLDGAKSNFKDAVEQLKGSLGKEILPLLTDVTKSLSSLISKFNEFPEPMKSFIANFGLIGGAATIVISNLGSAVFSVMSFVKAAEAAKLSIMGLSSTMSIGLVGAVGAVTVAVYALIQAWIDYIDTQAKLKQEELIKDMAELAKGLDGLKQAYGEFVGPVEGINKVLSEGAEELSKQANGLNKVSAALETANALEKNFSDTIKESRAELARLKAGYDELIDQGFSEDSLKAVKASIIEQEKLLQKQIESRDEIQISILQLEIMKEEMGEVAKEAEKVKEAIADADFKKIVDNIKTLNDEGIEGLTNLIGELENLPETYALTATQIAKVNDEIGKGIKKLWDLTKQGLVNDFQEGLITGQQLVNELIGFINGYGEEFKNNEKARIEAVRFANSEILKLEKQAYDLRLQMEEDLARSTETYQDDAQVELDKKVAGIKAQKEEMIKTGKFTAEEIAKWEKTVTDETTKEINEKWNKAEQERADKKKEIVTETIEYTTEMEIQNEELLQKTKEEYDEKEQKRAEEAAEEEKKRQEELLEEFKKAEEEKRKLLEETQKFRETLDAKLEENKKKQEEIKGELAGGVFGGTMTAEEAFKTSLADKFAKDRELKSGLLKLEEEAKTLEEERQEALRQEIALTEELKGSQSGIIDINNQISGSSPWPQMTAELQAYKDLMWSMGSPGGGGGADTPGGGGDRKEMPDFGGQMKNILSGITGGGGTTGGTSPGGYQYNTSNTSNSANTQNTTTINIGGADLQQNSQVQNSMNNFLSSVKSVFGSNYAWGEK